jgi:hypothetical protein
MFLHFIILKYICGATIAQKEDVLLLGVNLLTSTTISLGKK